MPSPVRIDGCVVWDIRKVDSAFEALSVESDDVNEWDS